MTDQSIVCGNCGSIEAIENQHCSRCLKALLVDLHRSGGSLDERSAFRAAKVLSLLGRPAPNFKTARARFQDPASLIVPGVSPVFARRVVEALEAEGVTLVMQPHVSTGRSLAPLAGLAVGVILLLGIGGFLISLLSSSPTSSVAEESPTEVAVAATDPDPDPDPDPAKTGEASGEVSGGEPLSLTEIGRKVMPSMAHIECEGRLGAGFFIDASTLLTNAHVACPKGKLQKIVLADERKILGETLWRDEWKDLARVRVVGADAVPLAFGDATLLEAGDSIAFIGSPQGLAFSLNAAKVSYVGRESLGLAYIQFDGSVNPGNSGGPLLDLQGRVLGVVSLMVKDATGIGLALPIQYLRDPATSGADAAAAVRWQKVLAHAKQQERDRPAFFDLEPDEPFLIGFKPTKEHDLAAVFALRSPEGKPDPGAHDLDLVQEGEVVCVFRVQVETWIPIAESVETSEHRRTLLWLQQQESGRDFYFGAGVVVGDDCELQQLIGSRGGTIRLQAGGEASPGHTIDASLRSGLMRALQARDHGLQRTERARERGQEHADAVNERQWRYRFAAGYANLDRASSRLLQAEAMMARHEEKAATFQLTADGLKRYEDIKRHLARSQEQNAKARSDLADLERSASRQSVPRHWRRRTD